MRLLTGVVVAVIGSLICCNTSWAIFKKVNGIEKLFLYNVYVNKIDANLLYVMSRNVVFKSRDRGKTWEKIFVAKDAGLRDMCVDTHTYDVIYVASSSSVYRIGDNNEVNKIFTLPPEVENICIDKADGIIYLGTTAGLYRAQEDFSRWKLVGGLPQDMPVYSLAFSPSEMYIATETGVYLSQDKKTFKKVFVLQRVDTESEEQEAEEAPLRSRVLHRDIFNDDTIYFGTSRGMYVSYNKGWNWQKQRIPVVEHANIRSIAQVPLENNTLYLATDKGVVSVNLAQRTSQFLFEGLPTKDIYGIAFDEKGRLYVATERGLFSRNHFSSASSPQDMMPSEEPTIREIQEVVLRYNEVHPEKVKRWRRALKYRGLFPDVSLDYDKTVTYDSGLDRYQIGPYDWGVSVSWDIGDLIWNTYEDDVDTRSRLMTQLRINILDDINSIYHERLRLKQELMNNSYRDEAERFNKQVRLQELTAALDGYSGGYFSQRLEELQHK